MIPKEKAKELLIKFLYYVESFSLEQQNENAKQCALISVDEIINECGDRFLFSKCDYWQGVKNEIEKL